MNLLIAVLPDAGPDGPRRPARPLASQLTRWATQHDRDTDAAIALRAIRMWTRLHGFVGLEIDGSFASMDIDPDLLFEIELATLIR
jgi:hypothetical protein